MDYVVGLDVSLRSVEDHLVGSAGCVPVQQAVGEGPLCLACRKGRQGQHNGSAVVDAARGDRLAHATKDMAPFAGRIG